jgi:hypothetical protein
MVQMNPKVKAQIKKLRQEIPYKAASRSSAIIIELPIGQLSPKDCARALFVVGSAFAELTNKQRIISKVLSDNVVDLKKILDDKDLTREELIEKISTLMFDPVSSDLLRSSEPSDDEDTESLPPS